MSADAIAVPAPAGWHNPLRDKRDKRMPRIAGPCGVVIFGVTGDLSRKKLMPAIYDLANRGLLPPSFALVGFARRDWADEDFGQIVYEAVKEHARTPFRQEVWDRLSEGFRFVQGSFDDDESFASLAEALNKLDVERGTGGNHAFYLSIPPNAFPVVCEQLKKSGLADPQDGRWSRVVIEKPFGHDLQIAKELNAVVNSVFPEESVFRIDHYLGKETVQNLIALRFANTLFEPLWNNLTIDHVQITVAETQGVGERWPYYDEYGAMGDMVQNHMMQLLCLVAMEPPSDLQPDSVRNEKVKVLKSLRHIGRAEVAQNVVRGQYVKGVVDGRQVKGYAEEKGSESETETFVAIQAHIDNWRWAGVPFFLRTGKRLPQRDTEIFIQFKGVPHSIFTGDSKADMQPNQLLIRLQPEEDIVLKVMNQAPGLSLEGMRLESLPLSLSLSAKHNMRRRIAYERLILDALNGVSTLFVRRDEVEKAWEWVDGVNDAWRKNGQPPRPYAAGSWGPAGAFALIEREGRAWHEN